MEISIKHEITAALVDFMAEHKMTQADVHNKTGVRKEYISIILKVDSDYMYDAGGAKGLIHTKHFNALAALCGYKTEKEYWRTVSTPQTEAILANLQDAREQHLTLTLVGETGAGKSFTAQLFAQKNPLEVFIVTAGSSDTLNDLIDKILEELRVHATGSSKSAKLRGVAQKMQMLKNYGHKPMLIIDEAEYLRVAALCAMKELYDNLNEFCSIVFFGTDQLLINIEKLRRRNKSGIPQFHRRIKFGLRILPSIDRTYQLFISDIEDKELRKFILRNCNNYGEIHDVIVPTLREAEKLNEPLTMTLVRKVLNLPEGHMVW